MKNIVLVLSMLLSSYQLSLSEELQMRTEEFPDKDMKSQSKKIVQLVSKEIAQTLPQTIDKYTRLVSIDGVDTTLIYTFEINTGSKSDKDIKSKDRSRMEKAIRLGVCQSSDKFLQAGINTRYIYVNAISKAHLFKFDIKKEDCIFEY